MDTRQPLDSTAYGLMLVLCFIWGFQQIVLKLAAPDVSPVMQVALRSAISAFCVGVLMLHRGERVFFRDPTWRPGLLVGLLFGLEYLLIGEGLRFTTASHMVVFLYTAPIFVALALQWKMPSERMAWFQWLGVMLAFVGVAITFFGRETGSTQGAQMIWGDLLGLLGGAAWGATTVAIRLSPLSREPATKTLQYQMIIGSLVLFIAALLLDQFQFRSTPIAWASLVYQGVLISFITYLAWFWLLRKYLASRLGVLSFLTPLFGVAFGILILDDPVTLPFLVGALLVLTGIVMVSGYGWLKSLLSSD